MAKFDWQHDQTIRDFVRTRWAEGKSSSVIAAEWTKQTPSRPMTKNDVIGAVRTHGLGEARPSPIRNALNPLMWTEEQTDFLIRHPLGNINWLAEKTEHSPGAVKTKLHVLRAAGKITIPRPAFVAPVVRIATAPKPVIVAPVKPAAIAPPSRTGLKCQWLNGSAAPNWNQCREDATHGHTESSWCDAHRSRVFVRRGHEAEAV